MTKKIKVVAKQTEEEAKLQALRERNILKPKSSKYGYNYRETHSFPRNIADYLRFGDYDFDKIINAEIEKWPANRKGFITANFGFPMQVYDNNCGFVCLGIYTTENSISTNRDLKVIIVGGPLMREVR